jgi:nucleotide-binding universal stress UspA family protein
MKILIGVDDSPHSHAALDYVKKMKWPAGTKFIVLSACQPQVVAYSMADVGVASWMQAAEGERVKEHEELAARVEKDLQGAGLATEARVFQGDPREALIMTATAENADLLVVGSHGRSGIGKLLMGSVASHVVTHAPCSVMVVKLKKKA